MAERIKEANVLEDYRTCKAAYGMFVNTVRAVPRIRDGLKFVTGRGLQAALELRAFDNFKYINIRYYYTDNEEEKKKLVRVISGNGEYKSARVVGDTMGKYHPHGDSSVYGNIKKMNSEFETNHPVFKGRGNWGNAFGDSQASMRYTEVEISEFAMDCVIGDLLDCNLVVDWKDNFDYKEKEVEYFPIKVGLLLVNGAFGIGVGIQCCIPPHNLGEVIDAHLQEFDHPELPIVLIPDFPSGCDIVETNWKAIANTGKGKFIMRSVIDIEEVEGHTCLVVKSLPERTFMNSIEDKIKGLIKDKKLLQVSDLRYIKPRKGQKENFRYIIELKKGTDPNYVREFLYKNTGLQQTFSASFEVLDDTNPDDIHRVRLSHKAYIQFINEQMKLNKFRLYNFKIRDLRTKVHTREAFLNILQSGKLDSFLDIIRKQNTTSDDVLIEKLMKAIKVTPLQAKYIINIPAKKFSEGYLREYIEDNKDKADELEFYEARILDESLLVEDIKKELLAIKKKYARPRKSKVIKESEVNGIPEGEFKLIITETNFVKKVNLSDNIGNIKGDMIKTVMKVDNTQAVLLFDEQGKVFRLPIHELPLGDRSTAPIDIRTILKNATSNINTVIYEPILKKVSRLKVYHFITVCTQRCIKKLDISDFLAVAKSGLKYTSLAEGDKVVDVSIVADGLDILTYSKNKALRMNIAEVPHMKRINMGMKIMDGPEPVEGVSVLSPSVTDIVVVTEKGRTNKINVLALPLSNRGKAGSKVIKLSKGDAIRDIHGLTADDTLKIVTKNETLELKLADIPEGSSISTGVQMIKVLQGDSIIKCELV